MVTLVLKVTCGKNKFELSIDDISISILELKEKMFSEGLLDVQSKFMKLMVNGKLCKDEQKLSDCNLKLKGKTENVPVKCLILIMKGHHDENMGKQLIQNSDKVLKQIEKELNDIKSRLVARMIKKEDTLFEIGILQERLLKREAEIQQTIVRESEEKEKESKLEWIEKLKKILEDIDVIKTS